MTFSRFSHFSFARRPRVALFLATVASSICLPTSSRAGEDGLDFSSPERRVANTNLLGSTHWLEVQKVTQPATGVLDDHIEFKNTTGRALYFRAYDRNIPFRLSPETRVPGGVLAKPVYSIIRRRAYVWSEPRLGNEGSPSMFQKLAPGETLYFTISHNVAFWRWRAGLTFYESPNESSAQQTVYSEAVHR